MINLNRWMVWLIVACIVLNGSLTLVEAAAASPQSDINLLWSNEREIVLEFTLDGFDVEAIPYQGHVYHRLVVAGMAQSDVPGTLQVPTRGTLLGVPTLQGLSIQVLESDYQILTDDCLFPVPETGSLVANPERAVKTDQGCHQASDESPRSLPGSLVEASPTGYLRDQAVARLQFYPVQRDPATNTLRLYQRVLARVTWDPSPAPDVNRGRWVSPAYEATLSNALLNYQALDRPQMEQVPYEMPAADISAVKLVSDTLKIGVIEDGLYELTYDDLTSAGLDLDSALPQTIKIHHQGTELPIYVPGEEDGVFDPTDVVLFYGQAITSVYTTENIYWLTIGEEHGQRMSVRPVPPAGAETPVHFPVLLHLEEDTYYWRTMPNGEGQDHYFWGDRLSPSTNDMPDHRVYSFTLNHISTDSSILATVRVRLKGFTSREHRTQIYLNGNQIDDQQWSGRDNYEHEIPVSHYYLTDGNNTLRVQTVDTGAAADQLLVNWIEIEYWDTYIAEFDELYFAPPTTGTFQFEVDGFGQNDVQLFEVSYPSDVSMLTDSVVFPTGTGYKLEFQDTGSSNTRYLALTPNQYKSPARIELDSPSSWKSPQNRADYILITHEDFHSTALTLADHRRAEGLDVAVVQVQDIYDEFNFGVFNPGALRDFLSYAYHHWFPPAPTYVVLLGDACQDYRDTLDSGSINYVPTHVIESELDGQSPSDNWFVAVSGEDILPDMLIGRLSARSNSEAARIVNKIIHYDQSPPDESWNKNVLLVADDDASVFELTSEQLADRLPYYYTVTKVYASAYPPSDPALDISAAINQGSILVNYTGHGGLQWWGQWNNNSEFIFEASDITALTNTHRLPVVTAGNCRNGLFSLYRNWSSVAELFQRLENRGAVAVWASSSVSYPASHQILLREFYEAIFQHDQYSLGASTTAAKINTLGYYDLWGEVVETFILFGDPATQLGIPTNYPYVKSSIPADRDHQVPIDQDIQIVFSKPMITSTVELGGPGTLALPFTSTWSAKNTILSYAHPNFEHGRILTFTISGQDRPGNVLGDGPVPSTWTFTVTNDNVPPNAVIGIEGGQLVNVPVTAQVVITFTEPVRTEATAYSIEPPITGFLLWDVEGQIARFRHADFQGEETYTFTLHTAQDLAGNLLVEPLALTFTTQEVNRIYLPLILRNNEEWLAHPTVELGPRSE